MAKQHCGMHCNGHPVTQILYTKNLTLTSDEEEEEDEKRNSRDQSRSDYKSRLKMEHPRVAPRRGLTRPNREALTQTLFNAVNYRRKHDAQILDVDTSEEPLQSLNLPLYMSKPTQMYYNGSGVDKGQKHSTVGYSFNCEDSDKSLISKQKDALSVVDEEEEPDETEVDDSVPEEQEGNKDIESNSDDEGTDPNYKEEEHKNEEIAEDFSVSSKNCVDSGCQTEEINPEPAATKAVFINKTTSCGDLQPGGPAHCFSEGASDQVPKSSQKSHAAEEIIQNQDSHTRQISLKNSQNDLIQIISQPIAKLSREASILRAKSLEEKKIQLRKIFKETSHTAAIFHNSSERQESNLPMAERVRNASQISRPQSRKPHLSPVAERVSAVKRPLSRSPAPSPPSRLRERRNASPRTQLTLQKCDPVITPKAEVIKATIEERMERSGPPRGSPTRQKSPSSLPRGHPLGQGLTLEEFRGLRKGNQISISCKK